MKRLLTPLPISGISALLAVVMYLCGVLTPLENMSYDWLRVRMRHWMLGPNDTDPDIVLCVIDDYTLEEIQQFPITRDWYAKLLDSIPESKMVGADIFFIEPSPKTLSNDQREAIVLSVDAVAEGNLAPEEFKKRMDSYLSDPDRELRFSAERYGKLFLAMFMPEAYGGMITLDKQKDLRMPLAEKIQDLLYRKRDIFNAWRRSPRQVAGEIAAELGVRRNDTEDPLTIDVVNKLVADNDMEIVKRAYGRGDMVQRFLEGEFDEELESDHGMSRDRIDHVRMLWYADLAAPDMVKIYKEKLIGAAEMGGDESVSLNDTAELLLRQAGIADRLVDFPEIDRLLRKTYVKERMLHSFPGAEGLITTFSITPPLLPFCEAAKGLGFAQVRPDQDGKVRKYPLLLYHEDTAYPALSLAMVCEYLGADVRDIRIRLGEYIEIRDAEGRTLRRIPINEFGEMHINWAGRWDDTFEKISFARLVEKDPDQSGLPSPGALRSAERLKDKIVLVGLTATGTHDLNPVPDQPRYPMIGVHANVISEILLGDFVTKAPGWVNIAAIIVSVLCVGFVAGLAGRVNLPLSILAVFLYAGGTFWAFVYRGVWVDMSCACAGMAVCYSCMLFYRYLTEEKQKKVVRGIFQQYMTPAMVNELIENPDIRLGGEKRTATVFFSDITGFTTLSEAMPPEELVTFLNEYLSVMTDIILDQEAYLDKYEGDAIMAVFGVPIDHGDHAIKACRAALANRRALPGMWNDWQARGLPKLDMRIGINTGDMVVGNMGSERRLDYTVIGDAVNLASRLEAANKVFGTAVMIGPETQSQAEPHFETRRLGRLQVKGKAESAQAFELLAEKGQLAAERRRCVAQFHEALDLYYKREWKKALDLFGKVSSIDGRDGPSEYYIRLCRELAASPPAEDWDGIIRLETK